MRNDDDDGQLTQEESDLIDRLREAGTPPGEVAVSPANASRRPEDPAAGSRSDGGEAPLTRKDVAQVVREETARSKEEERTEESRRQMTAHINTELDKITAELHRFEPTLGHFVIGNTLLQKGRDLLLSDRLFVLQWMVVGMSGRLSHRARPKTVCMDHHALTNAVGECHNIISGGFA